MNFFKNFDNIDFNERVILSFNPIIAFRNVVLIKENEFVDDIIFVRSGKLTLELPLILEKENIKLKVNKSKKHNYKWLIKKKIIFIIWKF